MNHKVDTETGEITFEDAAPRVPFVRSAYNYNADYASRVSGLDCTDFPSLAVQSAKDDADINKIVERFGLTGQLPENVRMPQYGDFTNITDFHDAMNAVRSAQESFNALPADVRYEFGNDPQRFLEATAQEENRARFEKLGLVDPSKTAAAKAAAAALVASATPPATPPAAPPPNASKAE